MEVNKSKHKNWVSVSGDVPNVSMGKAFDFMRRVGFEVTSDKDVVELAIALIAIAGDKLAKGKVMNMEDIVKIAKSRRGQMTMNGIGVRREFDPMGGLEEWVDNKVLE